MTSSSAAAPTSTRTSSRPHCAAARASATPPWWGGRWPGADPEIVAFVVAAADDGTLTEQALLTHCRSVLPAWMLPAEIRIVDDLPRTTSGKVKRRELLL